MHGRSGSRPDTLCGMTQRAVAHPNPHTLAAGIAARLSVTIMDILADRPAAHLVVTGGATGTAGLAALATQPLLHAVDFSRVHIWWCDEAYLPSGHPHRNETAARAVLQGVVAIPPTHVHAMPASDSGLTLEAAAAAYADELAGFAPDHSGVPAFDLLLLGIGPRGQVASLYPDRPEVLIEDRTVVAVAHAPEPPVDRITMSRTALASAEEIWLVASGAARTDAVRSAWLGVPDAQGCPASVMRGRARTLLLVDQEAGAAVCR